MIFINILIAVALFKAISVNLPGGSNRTKRFLLYTATIAVLTWFTFILPGGMVFPGIR